MLFDFRPFISTPLTGIIQIGAHIGQEIPALLSITPKVIAIEPQRAVFEQLYRNVHLNQRVIPINCALGSANGEAIMNVEETNQSMSSSLLKPKIHLTQYPHITFSKQETVRVFTLDSLMQDSTYNMLMMDVQGYELEVLKGAAKYLNNIEYIYTEVNRAEVYEGCPMVEDLDAFLSNYNLTRVHTSWDGQTWGDAMYVRR